MSHTTEPASVPLPPHRNVLSRLNFPVIGIGAAEGGLQALRQFFEHMPDANGMAFVIILHRSPRLESSEYRILQRVTGMPVVQVIHPVLVEKNHLYIISPSLNLSMNDGYLRVSKAKPTQGRSMAIDLFFRTLADAHRHWAYGIVLTGTGSDGALGLARIKAQGGLTLAQSPEDAKYAEMPRNAIATGQVDLVLPIAKLPLKLLHILATREAIRPPQHLVTEVDELFLANPDRATSAEQALNGLIDLLCSRSGHDFKRYKRATLLRRIERRMQLNGLTDLPAYRDFLQSSALHTQQLLGDMLLEVTRFFQHRLAFEALAREVLAPLLAAESGEERELRVWSAGCSTGEEPYSLAMLFCEQIQRCGQACTLQVFATDIDEQAIAIGRAGLYPQAIVSDVAPQRLQQFFNKDQAHYRVKKQLREKILFAVHDLLRDPPFCKLDLICCRNLLSYLNPEVQRELLRTFHSALAPGGYLFLGCADSAEGRAELFIPVDKRNRLYRAKFASSLLHSPPASPPQDPWPLPPLIVQPCGQWRRASFAEIHQQLLAQYAPASVLVDYQAQILHRSERAGQFLHYNGATPSPNLLALVQPKLRTALRTALLLAIRSGKSVETQRIPISREGSAASINMRIYPFHDGPGDFLLVLFDEVQDHPASAASEAVVGSYPRPDQDECLKQGKKKLQQPQDRLSRDPL
jgi:two-component system CheB/CheR fusion protein